jgi:hypothetical protein
MLNIIAPFRLPSSGGKTIYPDDLLSHGRKWDKLLEAALPQLIRVHQPLRGLIADAIWLELEKISGDTTKMPSVTSCYFSG